MRMIEAHIFSVTFVVARAHLHEAFSDNPQFDVWQFLLLVLVELETLVGVVGLARALLVLVGRSVVGGVCRLAFIEVVVDGGGHHQALLLVTEVLEVRVLEGLACAESVVRVLRQQLGYEFSAVFTDVRNQLVDSSAFFVSEVEVHVGSVLLEAEQNLLGRRSQYVVDFVYLV